MQNTYQDKITEIQDTSSFFGKKLEGGKKIIKIIKHLTKNKIAVMGHLGLLPQTQKGKFRYTDIFDFFDNHRHIKHTMITGGGPTAQPKLLINLCKMAKEFGQHITIETEGSEFVQTKADFISLSPKLSNSTPRPGTWMPYLNKEVTENDKIRHEKWRTNHYAMKKLIAQHPDYQLKPVISSEKDLEEVKELQEILTVPNDKVYLMPEGITSEELTMRRKWLFDMCIREGYNFSDRLQIIVYGDKRGV